MLIELQVGRLKYVCALVEKQAVLPNMLVEHVAHLPGGSRPLCVPVSTADEPPRAALAGAMRSWQNHCDGVVGPKTLTQINHDVHPDEITALMQPLAGRACTVQVVDDYKPK